MTHEQMGLSKIGQGYYTHPSTGSQQHREFLPVMLTSFTRVPKSGDGINTGFQPIDYFILIC